MYFRGSYGTRDLFLILTHVDDLMLISQKHEELKIFKENMKKKFIEISYTDTESDISFLGMVVELLDSGDVFLSQPGYAEKICRDEGGTSEHSTPATADLFSDIDENKIDHKGEITLFRSRLMAMMYLATRTRPDILKECTFLAGFGCNPGKKAFKKLARVYGYVRKTKYYGIILGTSTFRLKLFTDAAYALHVNARSHTGVLITFDGDVTGPVYCKSHVQKIVTLSSTESELVALVEGVKRLIPLARLMQSIGVQSIEETSSLVVCDNRSVLHIITNGEGFSGKSRHMRVRWQFVTELIEEKFIKIDHVNTLVNLPDLFTKPMGGIRFRELRRLILNMEHEDGLNEEDMEDLIDP